MNFTIARVPTVTGSPQVNGGAAQRSRVTAVGVTFAGALTTAEQTGLTYTLTRVRLADGTADGATAVSSAGAGPQVAVAYSTTGGNGVAALSFTGAGAGVQGNSLTDGVWQLVVRSGTTVVYTGPTSVTTAGAIYRLYGDIDGNRVVDTADLTQFDLAFGTPPLVAPFDYDTNGVIDTADLTQFDLRFGNPSVP